MKKVYVEITNKCNLSCSFCPHNKREEKIMSIEDFKIILTKLKGITKYLYLHVLGEPLIIPNINEFIDEASKDYFVNITTNGYYLKRIIDNKNIRQINISLHSHKDNLEKYLENIFYCVDKLSENTIINYRLWQGCDKEVINILESKYNVKINGKMKLGNNIFLDIDEGFIWPKLSNPISCVGTCHALRDHFGILVDGTIVPCCLDSEGIINLGNIFHDNIEEVLSSKRVLDMINGFKNNYLKEDLCKHCGFITKYRRVYEKM